MHCQNCFVFIFSGALFASTGSYAFSFYMAGASMICSSCLMVYPIVHARKGKQMSNDEDIQIVSEKELGLIQTDEIAETKVAIRHTENVHFLNAELNLKRK